MPDVLRTVGRYEVVRELGRGASGRLHLARRPDLDGLVALEELDSLGAGDPAAARRFVRTAGSLTHPNIVTVYDVFEHDGTPFVAMELLERGSLRRYAGGLTLAQVAGVLEGVLAGLAHAEEHGVVHGDLTPESLMVTKDGRVKIADLGIPRPAAQVPLPGADLRAAGTIAAELLAGAESAAGAPLDSRLWGWVERMRGAGVLSAAEAWDELEDIVVDLLGPRWRRGARLGEPPRATGARGLASAAGSGGAAATGLDDEAGAAPRGPRFVPERARPPAPFIPPATAAGNGMTAPGARASDEPLPSGFIPDTPPAAFVPPVERPEPPPAAPSDSSPPAASESPPAARPDSPPTAPPESSPAARPDSPPTAPAESSPAARPDSPPTAPAESSPAARPDSPPPTPAESSPTPAESPPARLDSSPAVPAAGSARRSWSAPVAPFVPGLTDEVTWGGLAGPALVEPAGDGGDAAALPAAAPETPPPEAADARADPPAPAESPRGERRPAAPAALSSQPAAEGRPPDSPPATRPEATTAVPDDVPVRSAAAPAPDVPPHASVPSEPVVWLEAPLDRAEPPERDEPARPLAHPDSPVRDEPAGAPAQPESPAADDAAGQPAQPQSPARHDPATGLVTPAPAMAASPAARRRRRWPFLLLLALAVVAAAVAGVALGSARKPDPPPPQPRPVAASAGDLSAQLPPAYRRLAAGPQVPGLALADATAFGAPRGRTAVVLGMARSGDPTLLPAGLRRSLGLRAGRVPDRSAVRLGDGGLQAYRYPDLRPKGSDRALTLYAAPTSAGVATVACASAPADAAARTATCDRVAATLAVRSAKPLAVGPDRAFAQRLSRTFSRLRGTVAARRRAIAARKTTAARQAAGAAAVARAYRTAARALRDSTPRPADRDVTVLVRARLRGAAAAWATAATAARARNTRRFARAGRRIATAERALRRSTAHLADAGYTVR